MNSEENWDEEQSWNVEPVVAHHYDDMYDDMDVFGIVCLGDKH